LLSGIVTCRFLSRLHGGEYPLVFHPCFRLFLSRLHGGE